MDHIKIARRMLDAAEMLEREEVMYALGLDYDHVRYFDTMEAIRADGTKITVEVAIDPEDAHAEMDEAIGAHRTGVQDLRNDARRLVEEGLSLSLECAPGGSGVCDGALSYAEGCECDCHTEPHLPPTEEAVRTWHRILHLDSTP